MDSKTTIALSTSIPVPKANPPNEMRLRLMLERYKSSRTMSIQRGVAITTLKENHRFPKKNSITRKANMPP